MFKWWGSMTSDEKPKTSQNSCLSGTPVLGTPFFNEVIFYHVASDTLMCSLGSIANLQREVKKKKRKSAALVGHAAAGGVQGSFQQQLVVDVVRLAGQGFYRLHHTVAWLAYVPKIPEAAGAGTEDLKRKPNLGVPLPPAHSTKSPRAYFRSSAISSVQRMTTSSPAVASQGHIHAANAKALTSFGTTRFLSG